MYSVSTAACGAESSAPHNQNNAYSCYTSSDYEVETVEEAVQVFEGECGVTAYVVAVRETDGNHPQETYDIVQSWISPSDYLYFLSSRNSSIKRFIGLLTSDGFKICVASSGYAFRQDGYMDCEVEPPAGFPTIVVDSNKTDANNFTVTVGSHTYTAADSPLLSPNTPSWFLESDISG